MADTKNNYLVRIGFDELGRAEAKIVGFGNTVDRSFAKADVAVGRTTLAMRGLSTAIKAIPFVLGFEAARRFVTGLFNANAESQRLHASLKTVTGSTEAAMAAFDMIREFAKTTPYELTEVVEAFIRLKSVGLDAGMESLRSYGNTAAATGRSLMQFIEAVADAATGEFERLRDFGITASSQGDKVAFTFRGVTTEVRKNAAEVTKYLLGIGNTDYASGMAEQADTLYGKLSNLADTVFGFWEELGNSSGAASALESIIGLVDKFGKHMTDLVRKSRDFWDEWQGGLNAVRTTSLKEELSELDSDIAGIVAWLKELKADGFSDSNKMVAGLKQQLQELETRRAKVSGEISGRPTTDLSTITGAPGGGDSSGQSSADRKAVENLIRDLDQEITAIENKRNTLGKAAGEIALVNARQKINNTIVERGIQLTEQQKLAIETSLGMLEKSTDGLERDTDVRKQAAAAVDEILKSAAEANEADLQQRLARIDSQTRIQQGTQREIEDNEKLIAALQKGEAEYDKTVVLLGLLNDYREAGIALTPEQVAALEDVSGKLVDQRKRLDDLQSGTKQFSSTFSSAMTSIIFESDSAAESVRNLGLRLAEMIAQKALLDKVSNGLSGVLTNAFNSIGSGGTSSIQDAGVTTANVGHAGWKVGTRPPATRAVPSALFYGAPRMHDGWLKRDEFASVLKRDEGVFTPRQMDNADKLVRAALSGRGSDVGVQVSVTNHFSGGGVGAGGLDPTAIDQINRALDDAANKAFVSAAEKHMRPGGALNRGRTF